MLRPALLQLVPRHEYDHIARARPARRRSERRALRTWEESPFGATMLVNSGS